MPGRAASHAARISPSAGDPSRRWLQRQEQRAVGEIRPRHEVLDAVQDHWPDHIE